MDYKPLPTEFSKNKFNFKQLFRDKDVAIFEKTKPTWKSKYYEVIKVGRHNGYVLGGVAIEPAETYPSSEQFGHCAWTYNSLASALAKADTLLQ